MVYGKQFSLIGAVHYLTSKGYQIRRTSAFNYEIIRPAESQNYFVNREGLITWAEQDSRARFSGAQP